MESTRNSMDPKVKEKHEEEHKDSKKEKEEPEELVITSIITRLPSLIWKQSRRRTESCDEEQCMEDLWMKALRDPEVEFLSDGGRRLWWLIVPSTPYLSLYKSLYYPQHPWVRILHQTNAKNVL
jgi:hypothetical protein